MKKVLIVEDSGFQRKQINRALEDLGYETEQVKNGLECLEVMEKDTSSFDLIMTDLLMPELDGFGLLKKLSTIDNTPPIVVLSSDIQKTVKEECIELGATEFVNKPVDKDEIKTVLEKVLG